MKKRHITVCLASLLSFAFQQPRPAPLELMKSRIESVTRSVNARWGIYVKCLETGEEIAINADEQMDTMSTIKIPLMVEAYRQAAEGSLSLTEMLRHLRGQLYATRIPRYLPFTAFGTRPPHKTGDFLPYIGNDVGVLETSGRRVVVSVFTANHYGLGIILEEAIGRITEQVAGYFGNR